MRNKRRVKLVLSLCLSPFQNLNEIKREVPELGVQFKKEIRPITPKTT